jgi:hypothetical protein
MKKSLKKEQIDLLRFEKELLGLGAGLAALSAGAAASAEEAVGGFAADHVGSVQQAYLNLVEAVQSAHSAIEANAVELGLTLLQANGHPKEDPPVLQAARAILGLG